MPSRTCTRARWRSARAIADHETLVALHGMAKRQLDILHGQDRVLEILNNFASKDMPGRQREMQETVSKILSCVDRAG